MEFYNNPPDTPSKVKDIYTKDEVISLLKEILYESSYLTIPYPDGTVAEVQPAKFNRWVDNNV